MTDMAASKRPRITQILRPVKERQNNHSSPEEVEGLANEGYVVQPGSSENHKSPRSNLPNR
ncbi:unnamed protein product [Rodentolepis nana]|uniref:Uncharacterized protein n=1 Tax=Rodentolepis nana TaxID=102285 RepID=A0A0R3TI25_RODNA|nr:unnamed protein product [Rodentolepis nana]